MVAAAAATAMAATAASTDGRPATALGAKLGGGGGGGDGGVGDRAAVTSERAQAPLPPTLSAAIPEEPVATPTGITVDAAADHVVLIVHGIGDQSVDNPPFVMSLARASRHMSTLVGEVLSATRDVYAPANVAFHPVEWHSKLHSGDAGWRRAVESITPDAVKQLRGAILSSAGDVMMFMSPRWHEFIIEEVLRQINAVYAAPAAAAAASVPTSATAAGGSGVVRVSGGGLTPSPVRFSIFAHSLGSAIMFCLFWKHRHRLAPGLVIDHVFCAGSPLGSYLSLQFEDGEVASEVLLSPETPVFYNLYAPMDPLAFRVEPWLRPDFASDPPAVRLPVYKTWLKAGGGAGVAGSAGGRGGAGGGDGDGNGGGGGALSAAAAAAAGLVGGGGGGGSFPGEAAWTSTLNKLGKLFSRSPSTENVPAVATGTPPASFRPPRSPGGGAADQAAAVAKDSASPAVTTPPRRPRVPRLAGAASAPPLPPGVSTPPPPAGTARASGAGHPPAPRHDVDAEDFASGGGGEGGGGGGGSGGVLGDAAGLGGRGSGGDGGGVGSPDAKRAAAKGGVGGGGGSGGDGGSGGRSGLAPAPLHSANGADADSWVVPGRIDYELPTGVDTSYDAVKMWLALTSHTSYWTSTEVAKVMVDAVRLTRRQAEAQKRAEAIAQLD
ncbi:hypothetical protein MMPV_001439 [Pyropia vietnamensis]